MTCPNFSTYSSGCRCRTCTDRAAAARRKERQRNYLRAQGHTFPEDQMDPAPVVKAVREAYAAGLSFAQIAEMADVSDNTIQNLYHDSRKWIARWRHDAIIEACAGRPAHMFDGTNVPVKQHRWKIQCLYAQGWTYDELYKMLRDNGFNAGWLRSFGDRKYIQYKNAQAIDWLVEKIGDRKGTSLNNAGKMMHKGIFPLIHYTEDGRLLTSSLTPKQRKALDEHRARKRQRVQSKHGANSGSSARPGRGSDGGRMQRAS